MINRQLASDLRQIADAAVASLEQAVMLEEHCAELESALAEARAGRWPGAIDQLESYVRKFRAQRAEITVLRSAITNALQCYDSPDTTSLDVRDILRRAIGQ